MQNKKLYVGNLTYSVTEDQLQELFGSHGTVIQVKIIEGKGFGFVEMSSAEEALAAKEALNGTEFAGRVMKVDEARPPKTRTSRFGNGGGRGGFGNRGGGFGGNRY